MGVVLAVWVLERRPRPRRLLRRRHEATGRCDPSLISHWYDTAVSPLRCGGPLRGWPAANVESRTRPIEGRRACLAHHADHGKGQSPPSHPRQPPPDVQQATGFPESRGIITRYVRGSRSRPTDRGPERSHATCTGGARSRSLGVPGTLSGERRQALGPEPATSSGQCELRRLASAYSPRHSAARGSSWSQTCTCTDKR